MTQFHLNFSAALQIPRVPIVEAPGKKTIDLHTHGEGKKTTVSHKKFKGTVIHHSAQQF